MLCEYTQTADRLSRIRRDDEAGKWRSLCLSSRRGMHIAAAPDVAQVATLRVAFPAPRRRPTSETLPPELLADVARRLAWAAAIFVGCVVFGHFGRRLFFAASGSVDIAFHVFDLVGLALVAMGLAVYGLARSDRVSATRLLDIGLVFEVLGRPGHCARARRRSPAATPQRPVCVRPGRVRVDRRIPAGRPEYTNARSDRVAACRIDGTVGRRGRRGIRRHADSAPAGVLGDVPDDELSLRWSRVTRCQSRARVQRPFERAARDWTR